MVAYSRYVALGDSQTEGLWDGDDEAGLAGFADRLAVMVGAHCPDLRYANLAIRGNQIRNVLVEQLPRALDMGADLITVCIGMNDVTRPGTGFDHALGRLDDLHSRLADSGATVVTTTFPDVAKILPIGRVLSTRVERINHDIRRAAGRYGFRLVDLYRAESMTQPGTWSMDRVHGSPRGHELFAAAAAEALGLPGSSHDWAAQGPEARGPSVRTRARSQVLWTQNMLMPWLWRHLRGQSSGDGRMPRRPTLEPVTGLCSDARPGGVEAIGDVDDLGLL